jgi:large subunit ribosomal protein L4
MRSALSVHAERGSIAVVDSAAFETPSTKAAAQALAKWDATRPTLVVLDAEEVGALKSFRNIDRVTVAAAGAIGVADVIGAASLVLSEGALEKLKERLS